MGLSIDYSWIISFTSVSFRRLRFHFGSTSVPFRFHYDVTSFSLRLAADIISLKGTHAAAKGKQHIIVQREKKHAVRILCLRSHWAYTPRARTHDPTRNDFPQVARPPGQTTNREQKQKQDDC